MSEEQNTDKPLVLPKGVAPIKKEFIVLDQNRKVNWNYMADAGDANGGDNNEKDTGKRERVDDRDLPDDQKRLRLRGQNKNKLRYKIGKRNQFNRANKDSDEQPRERPEKSSRLCLKLGEQDGQCPFGEKCEYSHDLYKIYKLFEGEYFDKEQQPCFIYSSYGKCPFSVACLFAGSHTKILEDQKSAINLIDHNKWSLAGGRESFLARATNKLEYPLQQKLRKRQYDLKIVDRIVTKLYQADATNTEEADEQQEPNQKRIGAALVDDFIQGRDFARKKVDFRGKLFLAPLATVGNLPFRRLCKKFSCDITCAEMSLCTSVLNATPSEWSHFRRHESEDVFGIQITANHPDHSTKVVKILNEQCDVDFIDFNSGCPTDCIVQMGAGAGLIQRCSKLRKMIAGASMVSKVPITIKIRSGFSEDKNTAHNIIKSIINPFTSKYIGAVTVHGRTRNQRFTKLADWKYIDECAQVCDKDIPLFGSGDCVSWQEYYQRLEECKHISGVMLARGPLMAPWLFTEIKERRTWDISSRERLDIIRDYANFGLDHWGSDATGIENCRKYLLEWLSFACRYIPVGLLEVLPQRVNERPPPYKGRDELETLLSSPAASDWVKISEMFLGKVPDGFKFLPKHKANAYETMVVEG